ncbi:hypothetical protein [Brasilonema sp. UFV-L1]|nr:hypothetical protein [Brasilonema sp. UFV-L1]
MSKNSQNINRVRNVGLTVISYQLSVSSLGFNALPSLSPEEKQELLLQL